MEAREAELMARVQHQHWWWQGRERILTALIERYCARDGALEIADAGAGYGANLGMLMRYGRVTALESMPEACAAMRMEYGDAIEVQEWQSPTPLNRRFDLILMADVLEHIEDDAAATRWVRDHLKPGGCLVATVPAHEMLWTEMDDVTGHYRRYTKPRLRQLLVRDFDIQRLSYYNLLLLPLKLLFVALVRTFRFLRPGRPKHSYNDVPSPFINKVLYAILRLEAYVIPRCELPFGVSVVLVARRRH